jgi:hypothetical protein
MGLSFAQLEEKIYELDRIACDKFDQIEAIHFSPEIFKSFMQGMAERMRYDPAFSSKGSIGEVTWRGYNGQFKIIPNFLVKDHQAIVFTGRDGATIETIGAIPPTFDHDSYRLADGGVVARMKDEYGVPIPDDPTAKAKEFQKALKSL